MIGSIIGWIVFGLIAGAIARLVVPGRQPMGIVMTMVLGIIGSLVGGFIGWALAGMPAGDYQPAGWILSIICAIVILAAYVYYTKEPRRTY